MGKGKGRGRGWMVKGCDQETRNRDRDTVMPGQGKRGLAVQGYQAQLLLWVQNKCSFGNHDALFPFFFSKIGKGGYEKNGW